MDGLLEIIGERGFDAAEDIYVDRGKKSKQQWQEITGRNYGTKIASDWRPDGWLADMDSMTTQQAEEAVTAAREQLAALGLIQAVTEVESQQAGEAKDALPGLKATLLAALDKAQGIHADLEGLPLHQAASEVKKAEQELANLRKVTKGRPYLNCPHCSKTVVLDDLGDLVSWDEEAARIDRDEAADKASQVVGTLADLNRAHQVLQESAQSYQSKARQADYELGEAKTALAVAEKLAGNADAEVNTAEGRADLMQAEQTVDDAKRVSVMVSAEARAAELSETIARYAQIVLAIGPQGVRAQMMEDGLKRLNVGLAIIRKEARWTKVEVTARGAVMWADRPIQLCSASEQWRAQAAIQLTLAAMTGSHAVVLDRADLLDDGNREGLVRAVKRVSGKTGIAVLLCSTGAVNGSAPWKQVAIEGGTTR